MTIAEKTSENLFEAPFFNLSRRDNDYVLTKGSPTKGAIVISESEDGRFKLQTPFFSLLYRDSYYVIAERSLINAAVVVPETEDGRFMLIKHYRPAIKQYSIEFPRGGRDKEEPLDQTAQRELLEETGHTASEFILLGKMHSNTSLIQSALEIYHAKGTHKITETTDGEAESMLFVDKATLKAMVRNGEITDSHTLSAIAMLD